MIAGDKDWLSQYSLLDEEPLREVEEVDKVETVTMDVVLDTIAPYNVPVVEEISFPSPDQVTAPEDRSCCPNSGIQIMNWGNRVGSSSNINFSVEFPSKDSMDVDTFIRLTLPKPTMRMRTRKHDCAVLSQAPNYQRRTAGWTSTWAPWLIALPRLTVGMGTRTNRPMPWLTTFSPAPSRYSRTAGWTGTSDT